MKVDRPKCLPTYKSAGKGMRPIVGYNPKNWYKNFNKIKGFENKSKFK
jgi:hypothetical protein